MYLRNSALVKKCKFFLKKVWEKFGFKGKMVVPLQPQTGNGGSRRGKNPVRVLRYGKKLLPLQDRRPRKTGRSGGGH